MLRSAFLRQQQLSLECLGFSRGVGGVRQSEGAESERW